MPGVQIGSSLAQAMEVDMPGGPLERTKMSPIRIVSQSPARTATQGTLPQREPLPEKLNVERVTAKAARRKKKKRNMEPAQPAMHTVRGFQTPVTSGGEESDISVANTPHLGPRNDGLQTVTSSPAMRPTSSAGGISALKLRLETLSLETDRKRPVSRAASEARRELISNRSLTSESGSASDSDRTEMDSYQVNLESDFVSPEVATKPELNRMDSICRKMTASDFTPISCLGKGQFGTVLLVKQNATGRLFAQKQLRKASLTVHKGLVEQTKSERAILESVNRHPFVVKLYYAFQDDEKLYLMLEYAQGGELFHHLSIEHMFDEETAAFYMAELVLALEHLHRNVGVCYRDLKPENCLLDADGHLLVTDFGLSKVAVDDEDVRCNSFLGTVEYMAPEIIQGREYGMAVDWWSLGALGFDMLTGSPPFVANNPTKTQEKIVKNKLALPYYLGPDAKDLLTRLLRKDPKKRLGFNMPKDLQTIKSHRFFRKIDWKLLAKRELEPPIQPLITDPELAENFSTDFTGLAMSPVIERKLSIPWSALDSANGNPFSGFSFVASESLLDEGDWGF